MKDFKPYVNLRDQTSSEEFLLLRKNSTSKSIFGIFNPKGSDIIAQKMKEFQKIQEEKEAKKKFLIEQENIQKLQKEKEKLVKLPIQEAFVRKFEVPVVCEPLLPNYVTPVSFTIVSLEDVVSKEVNVCRKQIPFVSECHPYKVDFPLLGGSKPNKKNFVPKFSVRKDDTESGMRNRPIKNNSRKKKDRSKFPIQGLKEKYEKMQFQLKDYIVKLGLGDPKILVSRKQGKFGCTIEIKNGEFDDEVSTDFAYSTAMAAKIACLEEVLLNCAEDFDELLQVRKEQEVKDQDKEGLVGFSEECLLEEDKVKNFFKNEGYFNIAFSYDLGEDSYSITINVDGISLFSWGNDCSRAFQDLWIKIKSIFDPDVPVGEKKLIRLCIEKGYPDPSIMSYDLSVRDKPSFVTEVHVGNLRVVSDSLSSKEESRRAAIDRMMQKLQKARFFEDVVDVSKKKFFKDDVLLERTVDEEGISYSDENEGIVDFSEYEND